jgi:hypothetical protein
MIDVPLEKAMLCWNEITKKVMVIRHPDTDRMMDRYNLNSDYGAAYAEWDDMSNDERVMLMAWTAINISIAHGIDQRHTMHALMVVPEMREAKARVDLLTNFGLS